MSKAAKLPDVNEVAAVVRRRYRRYPEYKPSGIDWIHEIPRDWNNLRLKYVVSSPTKAEIRHLPGETPISFVPMEAIGEYGGLNLESTRRLDEVINGYTFFRDGDVLVAKITPCFENGKGAVGRNLKSGVGFGTTELHVLRARPVLDVRFLFYITIGADFRRLGTAEMYGAGGQKRVPDRFIRELRHPLPPLSEQRRIAAFLDRETGKIDALVAKKRLLIERLKEKRAALISHAVTKGLNPDVPMKDSGIDWLGRVPEHWDVVRFRWHLSIGSGDFLANEEIEREQTDDCPAPVVGGNGVMGYSSRINTTSQTIVLGRVGALCGNVHLVDKSCWVTDNALRLSRIRRFDIAYLFLQLRAMGLNRWANTNAQPLITGAMVKEKKAALPPIDEQRAIISFCNEHQATLTVVADTAQGAIDRLLEYRTALISAAVTGKIDVRGEIDH